MVVQHGSQRGHQCGVVLQRLTHAHHHHIGDDTFIAAQVFAQEMLGKPELGGNFARGQVAAETLVAGGAETAAHRTPGLR